MNNLDSQYSILYLLKFIFKKISNKLKIRFIFILLLAPLTSLAESLSLLIVGPFLNLAYGLEIDKSKIIGSLILKINLLFKFGDIGSISILFIVSILLSNFLRLVLLYFNSTFSVALESELSIKSFFNTIAQDYESYINKSSSFYINVLTKHINTVGNFVKSFIQLLVSIIIAISILTTLFIVNSNLFISILSIFAVIYYFLSLKISRKVKSLVKKHLYFQEKHIKLIQESSASIKDIILANNQKFYLNNYASIDQPMRRTTGIANFLTGSPKFIIEGFAMSVIAIFVYKLSSSNNEFASISLLGTLGLGIQRFLPLSQQIFSSWIVLSANSAPTSEVVKILERESYLPYKRINNLCLTNEIKLKNVSYKYKGTERLILNSINLTIKKGERVGFMGKSGSGKSTLVDLIMGIISPLEGNLIIDNKKLKNELNIKKWRSSIAHVPQSIYLIENSILSNIALGINKSQIDIQKVWKVCDMCMLTDHINSLPNKLDTFVGERGVKLSGGQRQRIAIARALYRDCELLVLDEATSALDVKTEEDILGSIFERIDRRITIIMISHRINSIRNCDRVFRVKEGRIIDF